MVLVGEDHSRPHPVVAAGKLYLRDQDVLLDCDVRKSKPAVPGGPRAGAGAKTR